VVPILYNIQGLIIDMDGVLWRQDEPIGNLGYVFDQLRRYGCKITLATNNASLSIYEYQCKLEQFGVKLQKNEIINSSQTAAYLLKNRFPQGGPVYVVGENGLINTLKDYGFYVSNEKVIAVVVGMDRNLTFSKLSEATLLLRSGSLFVGTNADPTFPTPKGLIPGVGAILSALEIASERKPIVIGDRLETDILGAQKLGCKTALVLSGVSTLDEAERWKPSPDWIFDDLTSLIKTLEFE
jgi:4-nitrophenyl phosphatase